MIDTVLSQMTLEEQVSLLSGADFWTTNGVERLGIPKIKVTDVRGKVFRLTAAKVLQVRAGIALFLVRMF